MKRHWILMALVAFGCSKADLPMTPASPTTLQVIAVDKDGILIDSARVFVDGVVVGSTPFKVQDVQPGLHALRVTRKGFRIFSEQLLVEDGEKYTIEALMTALPASQGQLLVTVNLDSALVRVVDASGVLVVETRERTSVHALLPGHYFVSGARNGSNKVEMEVDIQESQTSNIYIEFDVPAGVAPALAFNVAQDTVLLGETIDLSWHTDGIQVIIDQGVGVRGPSGTDILLSSTTGLKVFTATAYGADNLTTQLMDSVYVTALRAIAPSLEFSVLQDSIEFGEAVSIEWRSNGYQVVIDQGVGSRGPEGSEEILFANPGKKVFVATAYGDDNMRSVRTDSVYVKEAPLPENPVLMLSTTRLVTAGHPATITWQSQNSEYVVVDYVDNAGQAGSVKTTFWTPGIRIVTATAFNQRGYVSATDTIEVVEPEVESIDDILVAAESSVRADKGDAGYSDAGIVTFEVESSGRYRVLAEVWYNSGDSQLNESYYLTISDAAASVVLPRDGNAGNNKVVVDDPGEPHTATRESGVFKLGTGVYSINVYHYGKISPMYPQFLNGPLDGPESVKILGFKLVHIGD